MTADFEQVCVSLVERGWKILPKKGSYPINKQGPRYINLVDPRGNRKSIRVLDSTLWEKLRLVESTRSKKKIPSKKHASKETETISKILPVSENIQEGTANQIAEPALIPSVPEAAVINEKISMAPEAELAPQPFQPAEIHELPPEVTRAEIPESSPVGSLPSEAQLTEEIEKNPEPLETFARTRPELQKSIFELGLDSLITTVRTESLSPSEIIQRVEDWARDSKNLIEYDHKLNEPPEIPVKNDTEEKEALVMELQATLKETEDKLAALIRSAREI